MKSVGFNQHASQYAGMNVNKNIILSMVISGAFAGLAGAMEALGTFQYASIKSGFTGIGFDGIAVALLRSKYATRSNIRCDVIWIIKIWSNKYAK